MTIDVWSDVICPWCYIGKRRFEAGLERARVEHPDVDFLVSYRPFQLDPTAAPGVAGSVVDALSLIHISEPTRQLMSSRMPSSA